MTGGRRGGGEEARSGSNMTGVGEGSVEVAK